MPTPSPACPALCSSPAHGANTCNCDTPVNNWYKNFGPRLGAAYQVDPKTVFRASYGVMFTHGNAVGGSSTSPRHARLLRRAQLLGQRHPALAPLPLPAPTGLFRPITLASGAPPAPAYGTGYTNVCRLHRHALRHGLCRSLSRQPCSGVHQLDLRLAAQSSARTSPPPSPTSARRDTSCPPTASNARGYYADQLDPKYLYLNSALATTGAALPGYCATNTGVCPAGALSVYNVTSSGKPLSTLLQPFPFQSVSDSFGYVANSNYNALQTIFNYRAGHGLTFFGNYTWSRSIDDGGTFRTGYAIPAGTIVNEPNVSYTQDRIERSASTTNQPHHVVMTGVYDLPFGKTILNSNAYERAIIGGFHFSEIFQAFSGSPLAITGSTCQTNPAQSTCEPTLNPNFTGNPRVGKHWGQGITAAHTDAMTYITPSIGSTTIPDTGPFISPVAPSCTTNSLGVTAITNSNGVPCPTTPLGATLLNTPTVPAYTFGNAPRTGAWGITGPGNYTLDLSLKRTFHLYERAHLNFSADWYNITNHTFFAVASTAVGNASFGQVTANTSAPRKSAQFSARIEF